MNDPFDTAARHHTTIERFAATAVCVHSDEHWRIVRVHVDRDDCRLVELMFRSSGDSPENRFQFWFGDGSCMSDGIVDGIVQIRLEERFLRVALDAERGARLGFLSNLFVFDLPDDNQARSTLENVLIWARERHQWDIRLPSRE